jgi:hypothetical protein
MIIRQRREDVSLIDNCIATSAAPPMTPKQAGGDGQCLKCGQVDTPECGVDQDDHRARRARLTTTTSSSR